MAVPVICCFSFESNLKKLFFETKSSHFRKCYVAILLSSRSSNLADNASSLSACGILEYKPMTSVITNIAFSGNLSRSFRILRKSLVSFMYNSADCKVGLRQ